MTLNDIYAVTNDSTHLGVFYEGDLKALYDGRESIPVRYNDCKVLQIHAQYEHLQVDLEQDWPEAIADWMIRTACEETSEGNYCFTWDDIKNRFELEDDEIDDIILALEQREEILDLQVGDETWGNKKVKVFDMIVGLAYCTNLAPWIIDEMEG